jgi:hypothetical protein
LLAHAPIPATERRTPTERPTPLPKSGSYRRVAATQSDRAAGVEPSKVAPTQAPEGRVLDTLAQPCQSPDPGLLLRRARSKFLSLPLAVALAELRTDLEKSYRNTVYCAGTLSQDGGKLCGKYCGNRWCLVCNRVRTARAITRYAPVLDGWQDKQFVTLTIRNVPGDELAVALDDMQATFSAVVRGIRRTDRLEFQGMRKVECTYNARRDDFHPHYHVIVDGREQADRLVARWLAKWEGSAEAAGQDVRPCSADGVKEIFKYFTKLTTRQDGPRTAMAVAPLDVIFRAMRGRRVWQPVGFSAPAVVDEDAPIGTDGDTEALDRAHEGTTWEWEQQVADWVNVRTGEVLTGYEPTERVRRFAEQYATPTTEMPYGPCQPEKEAEAGDADPGRATREGVVRDDRPRRHRGNHRGLGPPWRDAGRPAANRQPGSSLEPDDRELYERLGMGLTPWWWHPDPNPN